MNPKFLLVTTLALFLSCKKDSNSQSMGKSVVQLLTQQEWILKAVGFDDNRNNILDDKENVITECQKDNSYKFDANGSGKALDNTLSCGSPFNTNFNWVLSGNGTALEIEGVKMNISKLDENDFELVSDIPGLTVNYILQYGH